MKANTTDLIKFKKLQRKLEESVRGTVGLLEMLWAATAKNCPRGDVGKFSNEDIAIMVDWAGDPDKLVAALIECKWLDSCEQNRLVVHDWHEHCPMYVRGNMAKSNRTFANATKDTPKEVPKDAPKEVVKEVVNVAPSDMPTKSSQVKSSQAKNNDVDYSKQFLEFWNVYPSQRKTKKREAYRSWCVAIKKAHPDVLISKAAEYASSDVGLGKYAVMPSVWLNAEQWDDDPASWNQRLQAKEVVCRPIDFSDPNWRDRRPA
jgi:hypothetical protein